MLKTRLAPALAIALAAPLAACSAQPKTETRIPPTEPAPAPLAEAQPEERTVPVGPGPSATDIKQAVDNHNADLRQCYIAGTFKNAQLSGTVKVNFVIATDGRVVEATDGGSDLPDPDVVRCVLGVFADLEFSPGGMAETEVTYPVRFGNAG